MIRPILMCVGFGLAITAAISAQSLNIDFGQPIDAPSSSYSAAGQAGVWNSLLGSHGTTTHGLLDLDGQPTSASLAQIGGLDTISAADPATAGDHALLMDDYLVTFTAGLESCVFLDNMLPGRYEVLVYARMPDAPLVLSYTDVDQEPGNPHVEVGGVWPGGHAEFVTYSRHIASVDVDGNLDLHSGIVPGANPAFGAAFNGVQIRLLDLFADGFESGDTSAWSATIP